MINKNTAQQAKQAHRNTLLETLEHRLQVAKANGKNDLVNQLEAEKRYYLS
ncbi:hypothetical protein A5482_000140 [Cyanobacterium sp. IPPAS B-1200]|uniref:arginine synthesis PII-interacting regulator PirA n=1 Tax=Cyanobacterium sp. IPPAS B-1200 TaxID=1562720 RepID=UPI001372E5B5|nr:hypothetical protein [Cyanobacterium sp. IPPAS B-1200]